MRRVKVRREILAFPRAETGTVPSCRTFPSPQPTLQEVRRPVKLRISGSTIVKGQGSNMHSWSGEALVPCISGRPFEVYNRTSGSLIGTGFRDGCYGPFLEVGTMTRETICFFGKIEKEQK
jgi:hypothetical protein